MVPLFDFVIGYAAQCMKKDLFHFKQSLRPLFTILRSIPQIFIKQIKQNSHYSLLLTLWKNQNYHRSLPDLNLKYRIG